MRRAKWFAIVPALVFAYMLGTLTRGPVAAKDEPATNAAAPKGWVKGEGWKPVWGPADEVGPLNAMTPASVRDALALAKQGKVYDLGVPYDRNSFKWPGHSPGEILTFRGPEGVKRQGDFPAVADAKSNPHGVAWHSCALFMSDNVGTQLDGLAHITTGNDNRWYNGFKEADWGGNFGVRKCDASTIPPVITRGVMIDVAGFRGVEALPSHYRITAEELRGALQKQGTELRPGDTVLIRTGALRYWKVNGADHDKLREHDSAGIDLAAARWLVEQNGALIVGADTSGLEHGPKPNEAGEFIPVHRYLLTQQGVHIGEFHFLEDLARDRAYEFCYVCVTNKIRGATAGFALRPLALR